jgi:polyisoprenoid-binding protein YceI
MPVAFVVLLLVASAAAQSRTMDPQTSFFTVHVSKSGVFSAFGHGHEIRAPLAAGQIHESEPANVELEVDARQLKVLDPDTSAQDRAEIQQTMLGPKVLDSGRYPQIQFHSTAIEKKGPDHWQVRGDLTLHGQTRPVTVEVTRHNDRYDGSASLRQSDFGITPVRVAGGTVKVKNEVQVEFEMRMKD